MVRHASGTYGLFALVIGLLAWLHLGAQTTLYAAEINVVLVAGCGREACSTRRSTATRRRSPRSRKSEERHEREKIDVRFEGRGCKDEGRGGEEG